MIRARLGNPGGNCANADFRAEFDADACLGVGVFQIMDQLGHILDGVNIMVGWRTDEPNPGRGMAQAGNIVVDLAAG